jgi:YbbR domain-containing protein
MDEQLVTRKFPGIAVAIKGEGDASRWMVSPAQVDVTLTGPLLTVEKTRSTMTPVAKLTLDPKAREVEITIEGVPAGIGAKVSPEHAKLAPVKPPSPPPAPRTP